MLTIIGDVHGHHNDYLEIVRGNQHTVQLGDHGFQYQHLNAVDSNNHKIIPGNHDNYDQIGFWPNHIFQDDFGIYELGDVKFAYIRGADSIDKQYRIIGRSWWSNEQMSWSSGKKCVEFIKTEKPDIILSHDCPHEVYPHVITNDFKIDGSLTAAVLQSVFREWKPKKWVFGHHHNSWRGIINGTEFVCLDELETLDLEK